MNSQATHSILSPAAALLDYADILRSSSALVADEVKRIPPEKRLEFEHQVAEHLSEVALCLRDLVVNLGQDIRDYSTGNWEGNKKRWRPLRVRSEHAARQVGFVQASEIPDVQSSLQWMVEQGRIEELQVLRKVRERPSNWDDPTIALFDLAEQKIIQRVYRTELGLQENKQIPVEEKAVRDLVSLVQYYQNLPVSERERLVAQTVIEINNIALRSRDTTEPRGRLSRPTTSRLPTTLARDTMRVLSTALHDPISLVRREAAGALGEWGDESAVMPLTRLVSEPTWDENESVRRACVSALGQIGGPTAVRAIVAAAELDPDEAVRRDAIYALLELTIVEDSDSPIRREVGQAMQRMSLSPQESEFLRRKAKSLAEVLTRGL